jgi:hypothetical protein
LSTTNDWSLEELKDKLLSSTDIVLIREIALDLLDLVESYEKLTTELEEQVDYYKSQVGIYSMFNKKEAV